MKKIDISISLKGVSKKYINEWIFKNINLEFNSDYSYAITGPNGSGKSTLLNAIYGILPISNGEIEIIKDGNIIHFEDFHKHTIISSPTLELIEEFTLNEAINFHRKFKPLNNLSNNEFAKKAQLEKHLSKQIKNFSSGMKQRLKLGFCFFTNVSVILLDEPTSNLDDNGIDWYLENAKKNISQKLLIISSNQIHEYNFCDKIIKVLDFK